jgi:hypothetical protein
MLTSLDVHENNFTLGFPTYCRQGPQNLISINYELYYIGNVT